MDDPDVINLIRLMEDDGFQATLTAEPERVHVRTERLSSGEIFEIHRDDGDTLAAVVAVAGMMGWDFG